MQIEVAEITSPVHIDTIWEELTDMQKFDLWVTASGFHFNTEIPREYKDYAISNYKEVLSR